MTPTISTKLIVLNGLRIDTLIKPTTTRQWLDWYMVAIRGESSFLQRLVLKRVLERIVAPSLPSDPLVAAISLDAQAIK